MENSTCGHKWVLAKEAADIWGRFHRAWQDTPASVKRRFRVRMAVGALLAAAVAVGVTLLARWAAPLGLDAWDAETLHLLVEDAPLFSFVTAIIFESPGNLAMTLPVLLMTAIIAVRRSAPLIAIAYLMGYAGVRLLVFLGWQVWDRARPDVIAAGIASPGLNSYPSGHATISTFVYGFLAWLWLRASGSVLERVLAVSSGAAFIALVGYARMRLGSHWPSDILAGFVIGGVWLGMVIWAVRAED